MDAYRWQGNNVARHLEVIGRDVEGETLSSVRWRLLLELAPRAFRLIYYHIRGLASTAQLKQHASPSSEFGCLYQSPRDLTSKSPLRTNSLKRLDRQHFPNTTTMMPTTRSKTQSNLNTNPKPDGVGPKPGRLFQTPVFSRRSLSSNALDTGKKKTSPKKPLADLNPTNPLVSIVHQADKSGKQQPILNGGRRLGRESSGANGSQQQGSFRNLFANIWSALGINEQQALDKKAQGRSSPEKQKAVGASSNAIELRKSVLPPISPIDANKKCLVLDLDETLVHSSFRPTINPDMIIPVDIDGTIHQVYVCKRPGAEQFLVEMAKYYEIVVYTASLSKYADPLLDKLDPEGVIRYRLFREHCVQYEGNYVKDLSLLDRDISQTIIIDNSPMSYIFHPRNAIGCSSFIDDPSDRELESISRFLTKIHDTEDVRNHLHIWDANY